MKKTCFALGLIALAGCAHDDAPAPPRAAIPPVGTYTQPPDPAPKPLPGPDPYVEGRLPFDPPPPLAQPSPLQPPSPLLPPRPPSPAEVPFQPVPATQPNP